MDYLTQYYKNLAEQLQKELHQLTEAVLAKGDPTYYDNENTNVGWGDTFRGLWSATYNATVASRLLTMMKTMHPDQLRDSNYMKEWLKRLTKEELTQWRLLFPQAIKIGNGTNGVNGRIYHLYMNGKKQIVIWWDETSQTWRSPTKTGTSPYGDYINGGEIWKPVEVTPSVSSVETDVDGNAMIAGRDGSVSTSNKNTVV